MMQHSDREWERPCCDAMNRAYYSSAKEYYFSMEDLEPREIYYYHLACFLEISEIYSNERKHHCQEGNKERAYPGWVKMFKLACTFSEHATTGFEANRSYNVPTSA
jgi:hypothetical protein